MAIKSKDDRNITEIRNYKIVKANELIQKSRYNLQVQEQKIILYLISKIKPENIDLKEYLFEIKDFCKICGLDDTSGANYKYIKQTLKDLRDKSIWIKLENGAETTLAWIDKVTIFENSGTVNIKIDDMMKPYLLQLKGHFTQYELLYTLGMKSQYSIRLYELMKSYEFQKEKLFEMEELKVRLSAETYNRFPDFKRRVLDPAIQEINNLSDLTVVYDLIKEGRKYIEIKFLIRIKKDIKERAKTWTKIDEVINPEKKSLRGRK
jgi:plasmid replication initiation protein